MTTNTLAAIRERADKREYRIVYNERSDEEQVDPQVYADIAALLAIVDELTARAEAAEAMAINIEDVTSYTYWGEGIDHDPPIAIVLNLEIEIEGEAYSFSTELDYRHYDDPGAIIRALKGKRFTAANGESAGNGGA